VLFRVYAIKNRIAPEELAKAREQFFSKGQPCFRTSPLTRRYGWGVHNDAEGRIAIFPLESKEYATLSGDKKLRHFKALRSKRA
jgi:hypothetical protein